MKKIVTILVMVMVAKLFLKTREGKKLIRKVFDVKKGIEYRLRASVQRRVEKITDKIETAATTVDHTLEKVAEV